MQLLRRLILLVATGAAIWLAMAASLRPLVTVQRVDLAQRQADTSDDYLAQLGFDDYVEEVTQDRLLQTSNVVWEGLYAKLASAEESNGDSVGWGDRVGPNDIRFGGTATRFFFRPDEIPLDSLTEQFAEQPDLPYYVHVDSAAPSAFIEVKYHTYADEDFSFFTGGGPDPLPPGAPFYPYRNTAPWALLAGLLAYVVLPWRRRPPEAICYPYARIIPGDVISLLFFATFFGLPLFIVGGSSQAVTQAWFLLLFTWPFAFAGAWLLLHMAEYAAFELMVRDDGLYKSTAFGRAFYPYAEMQYWQPLDQRQPRWFIFLLWLAAITGKGGASLTVAGQAVVLGGTSCRGMRIAMKDHSAVYVWLNGQLGRRAEQFADRVLNALASAGVEGRGEIKVIRTITAPEGEGAAVSRAHRLQLGMLYGTLLFPLVAIAGIAAWHFGGDLWRSSSDVLVGDYDVPPPDAPADLGELTATNVLWERSFNPNGSTVGSAMALAAVDSYLLAGSTWAPGGSRQNVFVIRTDGEGAAAWSKVFGENRIDHVYRAVATSDSGVLLLGQVADRIGAYAEKQACIRRISAAGDLLWERLWTNGSETQPRCCDAHETDDGGFLVGGCDGASVYRLRLSPAGEVRSTETTDYADAFAEGQIHSLAYTQDGGWIAVGETAGGEDRFVDLALARLDAQGAIMWTATAGRKRRESGRLVAEAESGDIYAAGTTDSGPGRKEQVYVAKLDAAGNVAWDAVCGEKASHYVTGLCPTTGGGCIVVGESRPDAMEGPWLMLVEIDPAGHVVRERHIRRTNAGYTGSAVAVDADMNCVVMGARWLPRDRQELVLIKLGK